MVILSLEQYTGTKPKPASACLLIISDDGSSFYHFHRIPHMFIVCFDLNIEQITFD